jgi:hypothetical protein
MKTPYAARQPFPLHGVLLVDAKTVKHLGVTVP